MTIVMVVTMVMMAMAIVAMVVEVMLATMVKSKPEDPRLDLADIVQKKGRCRLSSLIMTKMVKMMKIIKFPGKKDLFFLLKINLTEQIYQYE